MIRRAAFLVATSLAVSLAPKTQAQWATQWHAPVVVAQQPVFITPQPVVTHVQRPPMVVYHPRRVYTRHRPILGGTVVRTHPGHRHIIF